MRMKANQYMDKLFLDKISDAVQNRMDSDRYNHTVGVAYTAAALAMRHGAKGSSDYIDKALIAGFLHDVAKCIPDDKLLNKAIEYNLTITEYEHNNPFLLHGKIGAYIAHSEFGIEDEDILNSVSWHTTGRPSMSLLEKIIFVADYIEPARYKQKNLTSIRELAFINLDKCVYQIANDTIDYINERGIELDEMTVKTRDYYKNSL